MEIEYGVTTEQANAALRVLRAAGINTEKMAEILQQATEVITRAFEMLSGAFKTIADAWENIKESGVLDAAMEPPRPSEEAGTGAGEDDRTTIPGGNPTGGKYTNLSADI